MSLVRDVTILYRGNFLPQASTENHVAASFEALGHKVIRSQEDEMSWEETVGRATSADMFLWTSTFGLAHIWDQDTAHTSVNLLNDLLPTAAIHLDLFWHLGREEQVRTEPWFKLGHVFTADGSAPEKWKEVGVNHYYLPPGVYHAEAYDGTPRREYKSDIAFVGSHNHYGHPEHWPVRQEMLHTLKRRYRNRFRLWPQGKAVRGTDLTDLYASVKVVVGDSCLAGKVPNYFSDRAVETPGRGGFLIHPYVPGILNTLPNLVTYPAEDWAAMIEKIDFYLSHDVAREENRRANAEWVRSHHTYKHRMQEMLEVVGLT